MSWGSSFGQEMITGKRRRLESEGGTRRVVRFLLFSEVEEGERYHYFAAFVDGRHTHL